MKSEFFIYEKKANGVIAITLNRPEVHNAFNAAFIKDLTKCFNKLSEDASVRLITLTGAGKSFCAGADLVWMKQMKGLSAEENFKDSQELAQLFFTINNCTKPVLAIVNGAALGGGAGLLAVCDYALACQSAKIGFTEVCLGLVPAVISPYVIAKIGESNARAYFLSGEKFLAETAKNIGLVHKVTPLDNLETASEKMISTFLQAGPRAASEAKLLVKNVIEKSIKKNTDLTEYTCRTIARIRISSEAQKGMGAILEKKKINWDS